MIRGALRRVVGSRESEFVGTEKTHQPGFDVASKVPIDLELS